MEDIWEIEITEMIKVEIKILSKIEKEEGEEIIRRNGGLIFNYILFKILTACDNYEWTVLNKENWINYEKYEFSKDESVSTRNRKVLKLIKVEKGSITLLNEWNFRKILIENMLKTLLNQLQKMR